QKLLYCQYRKKVQIAMNRNKRVPTDAEITSMLERRGIQAADLTQKQFKDLILAFFPHCPAN
ncbi:hypothetical protein HDU98_008760, partial [Podochytrium sp. JEL0797]